MSNLYDSTNAHGKSLQSITGKHCDRLLCDFATGSVVDSIRATIEDTLKHGNHYAYKVASCIEEPLKGDKITGTIPYLSGRNMLGVQEGKSVMLYELNMKNEVEKCVGYTHKSVPVQI